MITFLRGGGDDTEKAAKAGRLEGREKTIQDFLACVKDAKKLFALQAKDVVIYGRSAGGLLMGGSLAKAPQGNLFRGVFTEVP